MGDKIKAKEIAKNWITTCSGSRGIVRILKQQKKKYRKLDPVLIKASAGGGGKGMKIVQNENDIKMHLSAKNGKAAFGNDDVYIEKYLSNQDILKYKLLETLLEMYFT